MKTQSKKPYTTDELMTAWEDGCQDEKDGLTPRKDFATAREREFYERGRADARKISAIPS